MTKEQLYVESKMTKFDRFCQYVWLWPVASLFAMIAVGMFSGITFFTYLSLNSFVLGLFATVVMRGIILPTKVKRLILEFNEQK